MLFVSELCVRGQSVPVSESFVQRSDLPPISICPLFHYRMHEALLSVSEPCVYEALLFVSEPCVYEALPFVSEPCVYEEMRLGQALLFVSEPCVYEEMRLGQRLPESEQKVCL